MNLLMGIIIFVAMSGLISKIKETLLRDGPTISLALCVLGELIAPIFVVLGYKFRLACFLLVFTMFVAAFGAHFSDPLSEKEHSLLYYLLFLVLMQTGPGRYSLLYWLQGKKS